MFVSDKWKDYELIDASDGERLERWGKYVLVRPDPQVIWHGERKNPLWKKADGVYRRQGGGGSWVVRNIPDEWTVSYRELTFRISPMGFKHTGLFPEQATNWDFADSVIRESGREMPKVLNLFAYTGGATCASAKAGAAVVHVDASKGMTAVAKENMRLSGMADAPCRYIVDDCKKFVERELRRGNTYDGIIMDPPSYGRGPNGEVWKLEDCAADLITLVTKALSDKPLFFIINSYTTGLSPAVMQYILMQTLPKRLRECAEVDVGETCLPVKESGLLLPSGATVRVKFNP